MEVSKDLLDKISNKLYGVDFDSNQIQLSEIRIRRVKREAEKRKEDYWMYTERKRK